MQIMAVKPMSPADLNALVAIEGLERHIQMVGHADWCEYIKSDRTEACTCGACPGFKPGKIIDATPK